MMECKLCWSLGAFLAGWYILKIFYRTVRTKLPNGFTVACVNKFEALVLYDQIFRQEDYLQHGIVVKDGDCIFDVGANIGLFSVFLASKWKNLTVFAFEPIGMTHKVCAENLDQSHTYIKQHNNQVKVIKAGVGKESGSAVFSYDPYMTFCATMTQGDIDMATIKTAGLAAWVKGYMTNMHYVFPNAVNSFWMGLVSLPVLQYVVVFLYLLHFIVLKMRAKFFGGSEKVQLVPLRDVIQQNGVKQINFLKIDVEGAELSVLEGMSEENWKIVQQMVIEVHDCNDRANVIAKMCRNRGFHVVLDIPGQESKLLQLLGIKNLYCRRL